MPLASPTPPLTSSGRLAELKLKGLLDRKGLWKSLKEMRRVFNFRKTPAVGEGCRPLPWGISSRYQESQKTKPQSTV